MCTAIQLYMYHITEPLLFLFGKLEDVEGVVVVYGKTIIYHITEPLVVFIW